MIQFTLNSGQSVLIDVDDYEKVCKYTWTLQVGNGGNCYAYNQKYGIKLHHLILQPKVGFVIDHINRNGLDNRRTNLRYATVSQNKANGQRYKGGSSGGYKGVYQRGKKFRASIRVNGTLTQLGTYESAIEAAVAYNQAAEQAFGEYAVLNVV